MSVLSLFYRELILGVFNYKDKVKIKEFLILFTPYLVAWLVLIVFSNISFILFAVTISIFPFYLALLARRFNDARITKWLLLLFFLLQYGAPIIVLLSITPSTEGLNKKQLESFRKYKLIMLGVLLPLVCNALLIYAANSEIRDLNEARYVKRNGETEEGTIVDISQSRRGTATISIAYEVDEITYVLEVNELRLGSRETKGDNRIVYYINENPERAVVQEGVRTALSYLSMVFLIQYLLIYVMYRNIRMIINKDYIQSKFEILFFAYSLLLVVGVTWTYIIFGNFWTFGYAMLGIIVVIYVRVRKSKNVNVIKNSD